MRGRVGVHSSGAVAHRAHAGKRVPDLLAARALGKEPPLQSHDQILNRATLAFRRADHSANPAGLSLLTTALISLKGRTVGSQIGVELLTLGQQHLPEMFGLKAIRGFGRLIADVHVAR